MPENRPVLPAQLLACAPGLASPVEPPFSHQSDGKSNPHFPCASRGLAGCQGGRERGSFGRCSVRNVLSPVCHAGSLVTAAVCSGPLAAMRGRGCISYRAPAFAHLSRRRTASGAQLRSDTPLGSLHGPVVGGSPSGTHGSCGCSTFPNGRRWQLSGGHFPKRQGWAYRPPHP